ncbi:MAG: cytochrome c biogenesis protein CcsA [Schleiferiaceae bacterium]|nr:cytochrome c biogenesis protein CcsA [Schleiferiaceae bacterium]
MEYIGEHIWAGNLGRLAVILAFTSAILSSVAYYFFNKTQDASWKKLARTSYYLHAGSVFTIVGTLFFMMANHYFEYDYVWKHTSLDLPGRFLFSAFWEGQEGSFLLWMFWHAVIGLILVHTAKSWESKTVPVLTFVQAVLATMVMGVYVFGVKVGSSPFILIRNLEENIGAPWTEWTDYLQKFPAFMDGNGLNPLLQNYWMTIHPPTLFLGFALVIIPFCFAIAGLLSKDHKGWIKPTLPWAIVGVSVLGTGILMGGAWAYEALSFGGFWAWDPVENSSLVPWLTLVAAMHLMLIQRNKGGVLVATYFFTMISFSLVLYSTFLTRSGALGDTSVHAFVDLGLNAQLLVMLLLFAIGPFVIFWARYKGIPKSSKDENMSSREFWMFVGALILLISAIQITLSTSLPIFNSWFGPNGMLPLFENDQVLDDVIGHYNSIQVPFAIVVTLLMAITQFLSYNKTPNKFIWKRTAFSLIISLVIAVFIAIG